MIIKRYIRHYVSDKILEIKDTKTFKVAKAIYGIVSLFGDKKRSAANEYNV